MSKKFQYTSQKHNIFLTKKKGFTLIELLVTVAILGILASLAISVFQEYKKKVYNTIARQAKSDLLTAAAAWVGTDWNGSVYPGTAGLLRVQYRPNLNGFKFAQEPLNSFISEVYPISDNQMFIDVAVRTACLKNSNSSGCNTYGLYGSGASHCKGASDSIAYRYGDSVRNDGTILTQTVEDALTMACQ